MLVLLVVACSRNEVPAIIDIEVPAMNIVKEGSIGWDIKEPCIIIYSQGEITDELSGNIKSRGGISSRYAKHSFSLELENKSLLSGKPEYY